MVILSPSFTLLAAFCGLSGFTLGPSCVQAAAIYSPGSEGFYVQSPFKVSRSATDEGAYIKGPCILRLDLLGTEVDVGDCPHERRSSVIIPSQAGSSYYVAASSRSPNIAQRAHYRFSTRDENDIPGRVDIMSHDAKSGEGRKMASLLAERKSDGNFTLVASETDFTETHLVNTAKDSSDSPRVVNLQMHLKPDADPYCVSYNVKNPSFLATNPCTEELQPDQSRDFEYDPKMKVLRPFSKSTADKSSTSSNANIAGTESVDLDDRDGTSIEINDVTLKFVPNDPPANAQEFAAVESPGVATSTTTLTTTVTVTGSATPSVAAQDAAPTASSLTKPSTESASPTPASNEFQIKVEGPASSSSPGSLTPSSPSTSEPTTSVNAEGVASRIAADARNTASPTSPTVTPSVAAAALDETATSATPTLSSATPSGTPTPAALDAVDDNSTSSSSSGAGTSSAADIPTSSIMNSSAPAGSPTPATLAALDNSASSTTPSGTGKASSGNNVSATSSATPTVTPLNVLMEAQV